MEYLETFTMRFAAWMTMDSVDDGKHFWSDDNAFRTFITMRLRNKNTPNPGETWSA